MTPIAPLIEAFLRETLVHQRGASQHTCDSVITHPLAKRERL